MLLGQEMAHNLCLLLLLLQRTAHHRLPPLRVFDRYLSCPRVELAALISRVDWRSQREAWGRTITLADAERILEPMCLEQRVPYLRGCVTDIGWRRLDGVRKNMAVYEAHARSFSCLPVRNR